MPSVVPLMKTRRALSEAIRIQVCTSCRHMPRAVSSFFTDRLSIVQALIASPPTQQDLLDASSSARHMKEIEDEALDDVSASANATVHTICDEAPAAVDDAGVVKGSSERMSFHPFAERGPLGNRALPHLDECIPSIVEQPPPWWIRALSSASPAVASVPQVTTTHVHTPTSPATPKEEAHSPLSDESASHAGSPELVPTSPGGFDLPQGDCPVLVSSGSSSAQPIPTVGSPRKPASLPSMTDPIGQLLSQPSRPRALRVKNKTITVFLAGPHLARLTGRTQPFSVQLPGGLAAVDVINLTLWQLHRDAEISRQLELHCQWLNPLDFVVAAANNDGTPDDDVRVHYTGDRPVDWTPVALIPRSDGGAQRGFLAFLSHRRDHKITPIVNGCAKVEVVVRHEPVVERQEAPSGAVRESPYRTTTETHFVQCLVDWTVKQLPSALCRALFLTTNAAQSASTEEESLTIHYNGSDINVSQFPFARLSSGSPWTVPLEQMTVRQLVTAGVRTVSFTTHHPPPFTLTDNMSSIASSTSQQGATGDSTVAAMLRAGYMDDTEAIEFKTYRVRKRNDRNVWQNRVFAVDKDFIYNELPQEQSGMTKRPMRRIVDVESVVVSPDNPKHCEVKYRRTGTTTVARDKLEFDSAVECKHFVKKIQILSKGFHHGDASPAASSPTKTQTMGQRFLQLFR